MGNTTTLFIMFINCQSTKNIENRQYQYYVSYDKNYYY